MFDLFAGVHANSVRHSLDPHVRWVLEESNWRTSFEYRLQESYLLGMWFEDAIWQSALFLLDKLLIDRIIHEEPLDLLLSKSQRVITLSAALIGKLVEFGKSLFVKV